MGTGEAGEASKYERCLDHRRRRWRKAPANSPATAWETGWPGMYPGTSWYVPCNVPAGTYLRTPQVCGALQLRLSLVWRTTITITITILTATPHTIYLSRPASVSHESVRPAWRPSAHLTYLSHACHHRVNLIFYLALAHNRSSGTAPPCCPSSSSYR